MDIKEDIIYLKDIEYKYPFKKNQKTILKNLSFGIKEFACLGIIGKNGSGKTTLLKIISSLLKPTQGEITFYGQSIYCQLKKYRNLVNYSAGGTQGFYPRLNAIENLLFFSGIKGHLLSKEKIMELLLKVELKKEAFNQKYFQYSLGMRQRMHLAKILLEPSQVIIVDEPTNGLDENGLKVVTDLFVNDLKRKTKILVSHDNSFLEKVCTHQLNLSDFH